MVFHSRSIIFFIFLYIFSLDFFVWDVARIPLVMWGALVGFQSLSNLNHKGNQDSLEHTYVGSLVRLCFNLLLGFYSAWAVPTYIYNAVCHIEHDYKEFQAFFVALRVLTSIEKMPHMLHGEKQS
jgi:hypothetical protein